MKEVCAQMNKRWLQSLPALALAVFCWLTIPAGAQTQNGQASGNYNTAQDDDTTRRELANFDQFLDGHPELAEQLRKDPSLVDNREFVENHPELRDYLRDHPRVREEIKENPNAFMRKEDRYERHEDRREDRHDERGDKRGDNDITRHQLALFDQFMDSHPEIAEQLKKDPSLVDNRQFVENHPALQTFLREHPNIREEIKERPNAFMHREERYDRWEDQRNSDPTRRQLADLDQFLDKHREIAEQLKKDPSLVDNREFVTNHPALQDYLHEHPNIREEIKAHPNAFMHREEQYERYEDRHDHDHDMYGGRDRDMREHDMNGERASFGEFLGGHSNIADQLSKDPSLVKNQEYMASHPELQAYLKAHPAAQTELNQNPQTFIKSAQQDHSGMVKSPQLDPTKPKQ
jgi:hypothetical protein